jgi:hypothetical protein
VEIYIIHRLSSLLNRATITYSLTAFGVGLKRRLEDGPGGSGGDGKRSRVEREGSLDGTEVTILPPVIRSSDSGKIDRLSVLMAVPIAQSL